MTQPTPDKQPPIPSHNAIERERMPDGQPPQRGEQPGKLTNDVRNDPHAEPASRNGMPHPPRAP